MHMHPMHMHLMHMHPMHMHPMHMHPINVHPMHVRPISMHPMHVHRYDACDPGGDGNMGIMNCTNGGPPFTPLPAYNAAAVMHK